MKLEDILHEIVNEPQNEDLRKWFGKGKTGSSSFHHQQLFPRLKFRDHQYI